MTHHKTFIHTGTLLHPAGRRYPMKSPPSHRNRVRIPVSLHCKGLREFPDILPGIVGQRNPMTREECGKIKPGDLRNRSPGCLHIERELGRRAFEFQPVIPDRIAGKQDF